MGLFIGTKGPNPIKYTQVSLLSLHNYLLTIRIPYRIGLHTARVHQEAGRSVCKRLADTICQAVPQQTGAAPREQRQARDDPAGLRRGRVLRSRVHQGRTVYRAADQKRYQSRAH